MGDKWDKFVLLMWKNYKLQIRRPVQTIFEICVPILFAILLLLMRSVIHPKEIEKTTFHEFLPQPVNPEPPNVTTPFITSTTTTISPTSITTTQTPPVLNSTILGYYPTNKITLKIMEKFSIINSKTRMGIEVKKFTDREDFEKWYVVNGTKTTMGIEFSGNISTDFNIGIRLYSGSEQWMTNRLYPVYQVPGPRNPSSNDGGPPDYRTKFFLILQQLSTISTIWSLNEPSFPSLTKDMKSLYLQRFPYGSYLDDQLLPAMQTSIGMIFLLAFMFTCTCTVKAITTEKQKQLKESMKIMGLPGWLHWTAWFVKSFVFLFVTVFLIGVLMKIKFHDQSIITYSNYFLFVVFLLLYMCATITFCFAVSVFFSKANVAATVAGLAWFLLYTPYTFLQQKYDTLSLGEKLASCLGFNSAMAYGFQLFIMSEGTMEGIQWNNFYKPVDSDDNLSLIHVMAMLLVDCAIHMLVALYFEAIFPGEFGIPKPWYFPFTSSYWCGEQEILDEKSNDVNMGEYFEAEPTDSPVGVRIKNLRKVFGANEAVRGLSLNMFNGQITVLLGHNGAGKTTTMSMLTGMFPPTAGTAVVNGYDVRHNIDGVRKSLGLCPQHNVIFDDLTVKEHLYFFCKLKGLKGHDVEVEIKKFLELLELQPKENAKASTLSGGMKRKLCVGMALCGDSKVVMLDEPTAGMDPSARRALWNLIQEQKKGRTILLTTHFMDEADLLGDRIAIMAGGELQCCGSSFFLKKKYGAGYHLIMNKTEGCKSDQITALLGKYISNIKVESDAGSELSYTLAENQSHVFEEMLSDLENHSDTLGILSYGISLTTLEEVFLKVGAESGNQNGKIHENQTNEKIVKIELAHQTNFLAEALIQNQVLAMLLKRALCVLRSWVQHLIQFIVPVVFISLAVAVVKSNKNVNNLPEMKFSLDKYERPQTLVEIKGNGVNAYDNYIKSITGAVRVVDSIEDEMISLTKKFPTVTRKENIIGATFATDKTTAWFNNDALHALPLSFGLVINSFYKKYLGNEKNITFSNYPLPHTMEDSIKNMVGMNSGGFLIAYNLGFSMAFTSAFFILFYIRERVSKSKHLQFVSGIKVLVFWAVSFLWDLVLYILISLVCIITILAFDEDGLNTASEIARVFLILLYFCFAVLPLMYLCSNFFSIPSTGLTVMTLVGVFAGNAGLILIQVLSQPSLDLETVSKTLHWVFLFIPHYSMSAGIVDSYSKYMITDICRKQIKMCEDLNYLNGGDCTKYLCDQSSSCCDLNDDYFAWEKPGIGSNIAISVLSGVFLFLIVIANEFDAFSCLLDFILRRGSKMPTVLSEEDSDVYEENMRVQNTPESKLKMDHSLVLKDLTKYYGNFLAVNGLNLGVKKSECFGLLGVNGAGKTSTFKMMTGDEVISYGDGWVNGYSIRHDMNTVKKFIGYCPQFDALLNDLTARETLIMFCLIRGIPKNECNFVAELLARDFDFTKHLDKQVKQLSGGNKRKLSTAIALIGDPPVIYLDEPTTGMDPATKRHLWNALGKIRERGKCIILTSHSMEECEALCTRLAIMVNGSFKCLGSVQHLKNKFAEGYTLIIKVKKATAAFYSDQELDIQAIDSYVNQHFPGAQLRERHQELITYYLTDKSVSWSKMFGIMERGKKMLNIEDYSLAQSSLEQVFLTFTKYQIIHEDP